MKRKIWHIIFVVIDKLCDLWSVIKPLLKGGDNK